MPRPYPREFREDVVRVARNREPGVRAWRGRGSPSRRRLRPGVPRSGVDHNAGEGGDRVRTRSLRRRRRQPNVDAEVAAVPWCSGSAPRRRPRTRRAPTRTTGDDEAEFEEAAAPSRGRGRRRAQPAGPAHRRGGEPGRRVPGVPHRAPHTLHARELTLRPPGGPPSRRRRRRAARPRLSCRPFTRCDRIDHRRSQPQCSSGSGEAPAGPPEGEAGEEQGGGEEDAGFGPLEGQKWLAGW